MVLFVKKQIERVLRIAYFRCTLNKDWIRSQEKKGELKELVHILR